MNAADRTGRDALIVDSYSSGKPMIEVARDHGITRGRIQQIVAKAGATRPKSTGATRTGFTYEQIGRLYMAGTSRRELAKLVGVTYARITQIILDLGLPRLGKLGRPIDRNVQARNVKIRQMAKAGATREFLRDRFGLATVTVLGIVRGIGARSSVPRKVGARPEVLRLHKLAMRNAAIADRVGISRERVRQILEETKAS